MVASYYMAQSPIFREWDSDGKPLAGGQLYIYGSGSTEEFGLPAYKDASGNAMHDTPIVLDASGCAVIYLGAYTSYDMNLYDKNGAQMPNYPVSIFFAQGVPVFPPT